MRSAPSLPDGARRTRDQDPSSTSTRAVGVGAQQPFDALVVDGLPVVQALRVPAKQDLGAVPSPLGDLGRVRARAQPRGQRRVPQVVRPFRDWGAPLRPVDAGLAGPLPRARTRGYSSPSSSTTRPCPPSWARSCTPTTSPPGRPPLWPAGPRSATPSTSTASSGRIHPRTPDGAGQAERRRLRPANVC